MKIAEAVEEVNEMQKMVVVDQIISQFREDLSLRTFAFWGLSFKPQTDDMREAPSIIVVTELVKRGAKVKSFDPEAYEIAKQYLSQVSKNDITYEDDMWQPLENADALILLTEWKQFRQPDFNKIKSLLQNPIIFDGRNQYDPKQIPELGFEHYCIGRNI